MAYDIIHKNSTVAGTPPAASEIEVGEIAINAADAELYTKDTDGNVQTFISQFTQDGTGAVARTVASKLKDVVSVKDFGAVGDGVTDDTAAIQAALNAADGRPIVFEGGKTYLISSAITLTGKDVSITSDGKPATIFLNGQSDNGLTIQNTAALATSLSAPTAKYSRTWTVPDASAVQPGMLMEIKSNVLWYYDPRGVTKKSELHLVQSVSGNDIQSYLPANDGYDTASETVTVTFYDPLTVSIDNIKLKAVPQLNTTTPKQAVILKYAAGARITDLATEGFQDAGLKLIGCYDTYVTRHTGIDVNYWKTGYGAQTYGCTNTVFSNCYYRGCRRGIDISGSEVISLHTLIESCTNDGGGYSSTGNKWGRTDSASVTGAEDNFGFGSHGPSDYAVYKNNLSNCFYGINTRGGNEIIEGNRFLDYTRNCVLLQYGANRIVRGNVSQPGLTDKDVTRYDGGPNVYNYTPFSLVRVHDAYDGGDMLEVSDNSVVLNGPLIQFESGAVVPTAGLTVKNNNVQFVVPTAAADTYVFLNQNASFDPSRNFVPSISAYSSGNSYVRTGTGKILLSQNITFSAIGGNFQGTYTPTLTPITNVTAASVPTLAWRYVVSDNVVQIFGTLDVTHTADTGTNSRLSVSLPLPVNFSTNNAGAMFVYRTAISKGTSSYGQGEIDTTGDVMQLTIESSTAGTSLRYRVHGWYYLKEII